MRATDPIEDQEIQAIIERGRQIRRAPDVVRARLFARARAAAATADAVVPPVGVPRLRLGLRLAVAATVLLAFAAGAAAALHVGAFRAGAVEPAPPPSPERSSPRRAALDTSDDSPAPQRSLVGKSHHLRVAPTPQESYAAELALLQRAQSEYASQDFPNALVLVAEHARRFPNGRLAEEREGLRVRSLAGANRGDEARRALASFARRFPRSVLLPRLQEVARTAEN